MLYDADLCDVVLWFPVLCYAHVNYYDTSATGATPLYCYRNETSDVNFIATAYAKLCDAASDYAIVG